MQNFSTAMVVVAVALVDRDRRVLMQKRHRDSMHGGLWEFPGGKIEPGESPESAIIREITEELGIVLSEDDLHPLSFASGTTTGAGDSRPLVILLYTCTRWSGKPQCLEGEAIAWCGANYLAALEMPPLDYPLAQVLVEKFLKV